MNKYVVIVIGIIVVIISALTILNTPSETTILLPSPYAEDRASAVKVIADNLEFPTGVAILPDKRIVITEQTGKTLILTSNGSQLNNYKILETCVIEWAWFYLKIVSPSTDAIILYFNSSWNHD